MQKCLRKRLQVKVYEPGDPCACADQKHPSCGAELVRLTIARILVKLIIVMETIRTNILKVYQPMMLAMQQ